MNLSCNLSEAGSLPETAFFRMPQFKLRVGSRSEQGVRANNEDNLIVDMREQLFVVADGMGGQDRGEVASSMAVEIIPRVIHARLAVNEAPDQAVLRAMQEANDTIIEAGRPQPEGRRMGTTAVVALARDDQVYVCNLGDSRAYLIRGHDVKQLTVDHSVAQALVAAGSLSPEEARFSPYQHVLHKFLGCVELNGFADVVSFAPQDGDRLLLATDGLTNHITLNDLSTGPKVYPDPQVWIEYLVKKALTAGSRDNVTGVVVAFEQV